MAASGLLSLTLLALNLAVVRRSGRAVETRLVLAGGIACALR